MSLCAKYIKNTTNCSEIPNQDLYLKSYRQTLNDNRNVVTKQFALNYDKSYYPVSSTEWSSCDPRLVDQVRGIKTTLSRPPLKLDVNCDLTNIDYNGKVTSYPTLNDINIGDYIYYYNEDLSQPFIPTNFSIPARIKKELFIDPMTSVKPQYYREKEIYSVGCDQPTRDQLTFREDMMERFLRKPNQRSWQNFYSK